MFNVFDTTIPFDIPSSGTNTICLCVMCLTLRFLLIHPSSGTNTIGLCLMCLTLRFSFYSLLLVSIQLVYVNVFETSISVDMPFFWYQYNWFMFNVLISFFWYQYNWFIFNAFDTTISIDKSFL